MRGALLRLTELLVGADCLWRLPAFLRQPLTVAEAGSILRRRQERRCNDFLDLVRRAIYEHPASPYRPLMRHTGLEYGDLASLVERDGVEGALRTLVRAGVYLTLAEFKGRQPVRRGSLVFRIAPVQLRNPAAGWHLTGQTSGSRGSRTLVPMDLAFLRDRAVDDLLALAAQGWQDSVFGVWKVPGSDALQTQLRLAGLGVPVARWFSQVDPKARGLDARYRWGQRLVRWTAAAAGVPLPRPEHVPLDDPRPMIRWMKDVCGAGRAPHVQTFVSSAVRVCRVALDAGVDLTGVRLTIGGELVTAACVAIIRRAGAEVRSRYLATEAGLIGLGCCDARVPDEVHVCEDLNAVISAEASSPPLPAESILVSSLRATAPLVLLNVAVGEQGVLGTRQCGCPLETLGWKTHLHALRSLEKLTAGGVTFLDADVIRVLEEVLPARFGGGPTDYQLVEDTRPDGDARLRLLVRPEVGRLDPERVVDAFLTAVSQSTGPGGVVALAWREGRVLRVERRSPLLGASEKVLHLHVSAGSAPVPAGSRGSGDDGALTWREAAGAD
jgi:hypothetical protein